jgi:TonB-linked SusC/RagA family outer membrane protein
MNKIICLLSLVIGVNLMASGQKKISGQVIDHTGLPIKGALIQEVGKRSNNTITNEDGTFVLQTIKADVIDVVIADAKFKRVIANGDSVLKIVIHESDLIEDMGHVKVTPSRQTQALTTVNSDEILKNSSVSVSDAITGVLPVNFRGNSSPLIVVDGFPRDWSYLAKEEVESVTVLKDASATALWGARGANGVISVTTKRGTYDSKKISISYVHGIGLPTNMPQMADAPSYANAINEALSNDGLPLRYSPVDIANFSSGTGDPDFYPNVNWLKEVLQDYDEKNQLNLTFQGGGNRVRYFSLVNYKNSLGILNPKYTEYDGRFSAQKRTYDLNIRTNLDIDATRTTHIKFTLLGKLSEDKGPFASEASIFNNLVNIPSAAFPIYTLSGAWGSDNIFRTNPIANIASTGYLSRIGRTLLTDIRIIQDLSMISDNLSIEVGAFYDNNAIYGEQQSKSYAYEVNSLLQGNESALAYSSALMSQFINSGLDAKILYDRAFGANSLIASAIYRQETSVPLGRNTTRKRQYLIGTAGYNFSNRYMIDLVANYYGTSLLSTGDKFRNYPAVSAGWVISNESFFSSKSLDLLKLRASWGKSGYDGNLQYELDRQYWIGGSLYTFQDGNVVFGGTKEGPLPMDYLTPENGEKLNLGVDMTAFKKLTLTADAFYERRSNILVDNNKVISSAIGIALPGSFAGINDVKGYEISATWNENIRPFKYWMQGNFTFARTKVIENNEGFIPYDYLSRKGNRVGQFYGLQAIGYFNDFTDINNSPKQVFSDVKPGDIKYKDQNNDGIINQYDVVASGYSTSLPEIYYGIKLGFEYKGFGIDALFQGVTNYSQHLSTASVYWPLRNNTNISTWYLNDNVRWTEATKATANLPRLSTLDNANNFQNNTQWLVDGSYFSLRNLNIYFNIPQSLIKKIKIDNCQLYARANNLFTFYQYDRFVVGYPNVTNIFLGLKFNF